jgi:ABC-type amino acid transport substrate-binding protein
MRRALTAAGLACLQAATVAAADLPAIKARGALRVLVCAGIQPMLFAHVAGERPGFDREIVEGFARVQQLRLEVVAVPAWGELLPALLADKGDVVVGGYTDTPERRAKIAFTPEVFPTRAVIVTRAPHPVVRDVEQLRREKLGVVQGSSLAQDLQRAGVPSANVVILQEPVQHREVLAGGRVTAVPLDLEDAVLAARADATLQLGMFVGAPRSQAYGLRPQDVALRRALGAHVEQLRGSPKWSQLVVKYFGGAALDILRSARLDEPRR